MIYYLAGGSKSGKSMLAQRIVRAMPGPHYYVATMRPKDAEDDARIEKHGASKPWNSRSGSASFWTSATATALL